MTSSPEDVLGVAAVVGRSFAVAHVAAAAGCTALEVLDALADPVARGDVALDAGGGRFLSHDAHAAAAAAIGPGRIALVHDAVATSLLAALESSGAEAAPLDLLVSLGEHALGAASLAAATRARADRWVPVAARRLVEAGRAGDASRLLDGLAAGSESVGLPVVLQHGDALLRAGRLEASRTAFGEAVRLARLMGDDAALARAALGAGGIWVNEHRGSAEAEQALALWREARSRLDPNDASHVLLALRLDARLAAEDAYLARDPAPYDLAEDAIARLREHGDAAALGEALTLFHHVLLGPDHRERRERVVNELRGVALRSRDELLILQSLSFLAVGALLVGDPWAPRAVAKLRDRLAGSECAGLAYMVELIDIMRLTATGSLDEAAERAEVALGTGIEVGDRDAVGYYACQLLAIRWRQGRDVELLEAVGELVSSPTVAAGNPGFLAAEAAIAARAGDHDRARRSLARMPDGGPAALPSSSGWLVTVFCLAEAARELGDADLAAACYRVATPFADLPVYASVGVACFGPVERILARTAATCGRAAEAVAHQERAIEACRRLDEQVLVEQLERELEALRRALPTASRAARLGVRRVGRGWEVEWAGRRAPGRALVGFAYLAELATAGDAGISALELVARTSATGADAPQLVLDAQALTALRSRLAALQADIEEAERWHDGERAHALAGERDAVLGELAKALDVRGTSRSFADPGERARVSVRKALLRAVDEVEAADASLGAHLREVLVTGHVCVLRGT